MVNLATFFETHCRISFDFDICLATMRQILNGFVNKLHFDLREDHLLDFIEEIADNSVLNNLSLVRLNRFVRQIRNHIDKAFIKDPVECDSLLNDSFGSLFELLVLEVHIRDIEVCLGIDVFDGLVGARKLAVHFAE